MKLYGLTFKNDALEMVLKRSTLPVDILSQILSEKCQDVGKKYGL
jgi:hypothetical protein